ncbi:MAG TPA: calcium/sodium antiporter, partial [Vibrio sp.]|nr:calcium/sodium antiporter [Vibrio sp.]
LGKSRSVNRIEGGVLIVTFVAYQAYLLMNMSA